MAITEFGRVELDPTVIPRATVTKAPDPSFEDDLRSAIADEPRREQAVERVDTRNPEPVEPETPPVAADAPAEPETTEPNSAPVATTATNPARVAADATAPAAALEPAAGSAQTIEVGAPVGRKQATAASAPTSPLLNTTEQAPSEASARTTVAPVAQTVDRGQAATRPATPNRESVSGVRAKAATTPGYRTVSPGTLRMAEAARESVFRQIAMRMNREGGEMRVLLDPPELGELDMRVVVENGNQLRLSVVAERPEIAAMLDKHMSELKSVLEAQGLEVGDTEVRSGHSGMNDRTRADREPWASETSGDDDGGDQGAQLPRIGHGFVTADGLDYWA